MSEQLAPQEFDSEAIDLDTANEVFAWLQRPEEPLPELSEAVLYKIRRLTGEVSLSECMQLTHELNEEELLAFQLMISGFDDQTIHQIVPKEICDDAIEKVHSAKQPALTRVNIPPIEEASQIDDKTNPSHRPVKSNDDHDDSALQSSPDVYNMYLQDLRKNTKLLTAEQEVDLSKAIETGLFAEKILSGEFQTTSDATTEELEWLVEQGEMAKELFITSNLRLSVSIARRFGAAATAGFKMEDIVQEGNFGVIRAVEKFDYKKGFKFSTYATPWIRQYISRAISNQARTVRIPVHREEIIRKVLKYQRQVVNDLHREPTYEEIMKECNVGTKKELQQLLDDARTIVYLDTPLGVDGEATLGDLIEDKVVRGPGDEVLENEMVNELNDLLDTSLVGRERYVIRARFGLINGRVHTLKDVGDSLGISSERVRQIERSALARLQAAGLDRLAI